ncbi:MAG: N-acetylmuramoyl-L-alanine amidase [Gammaproteobacteria bacterium]
MGRLTGALCGALFALACGLAKAATAVDGVRMWQQDRQTRLVFDLSAPARHHLSRADSPDRIILDLGDARLRGNLQTPDLSGTPVQRIRSGLFGKQDLRIVLDLAAAVEAKSFMLPPSDGHGHRLVVDLRQAGLPSPNPPAVESRAAGQAADAPADRASTVPPIADPGTTPAATTVASAGAATVEARAPAKALKPEPLAPMSPVAPRGRDILIAIDAGHGGEDPGAIGPRRVREKDVVLAIAKELQAAIDREEGYRAMMVRKGDYFIPLRQRRDIARAAGADLFVSIHADAFTHSRARGGSVYALSPRGATSVSAAFLAQRENGADLIGGVNLGEKDDVLASVLTDLSMTATLDASIGAGNRVLRSMGRVAQLHKRQVEQAGFAVLKSPDMPSILVETGFISNPGEAERLATRAYQRNMARAILEGVGAWFLSAPPPGTLIAARARGGAKPGEYVIARGDTLSGIAERYRVSVDSLVRTNGLGGSGGIQAGQRIVIPQS